MNDVTGPQASYGMSYILLNGVWQEHIEMFPKRKLKTPENTQFKQNAQFKALQKSECNFENDLLRLPLYDVPITVEK